MGFVIQCDGCQTVIHGHPGIIFVEGGYEKPPQMHLCADCYKAAMQFLGDMVEHDCNGRKHNYVTEFRVEHAEDGSDASESDQS